jgi:hypothetical protein
MGTPTPVEEERKVGALPVERGAGEGAAGSPAASEAPKVYTYVAEWRSTNMGAITREIVVCMVCRRVLEPTRRRRSRSGTHGEDYYVHEHPMISIILEQSNSGKRYVSVPKELEKIKELVERAWVYEDASISDIKASIEQYLKLGV